MNGARDRHLIMVTYVGSSKATTTITPIFNAGLPRTPSNKDGAESDGDNKNDENMEFLKYLFMDQENNYVALLDP